LGHPAKAQGSEYSGSTAWEGAVRARLYLSDRPPDQDPEDEDAPLIDDQVRYLSRRKANYSALDIRRIALLDGGIFAPATTEAAKAVQPKGPAGELLKDVVRRAVQLLGARGLFGSTSSRAGNYLPKLAKQYRLLDTTTEAAFAGAMREMFMAGNLIEKEVGKYPNRAPRMGLGLPD
jgi:hypothetical protein